jgi:hypothetical protein
MDKENLEYEYTMEYYAAMKKDEIVSFARKWTGKTDITCSPSYVESSL